MILEHILLPLPLPYNHVSMIKGRDNGVVCETEALCAGQHFGSCPPSPEHWAGIGQAGQVMEETMFLSLPWGLEVLQVCSSPRDAPASSPHPGQSWGPLRSKESDWELQGDTEWFCNQVLVLTCGLVQFFPRVLT